MCTDGFFAQLVILPVDVLQMQYATVKNSAFQRIPCAKPVLTFSESCMWRVACCHQYINALLRLYLLAARVVQWTTADNRTASLVPYACKNVACVKLRMPENSDCVYIL
jgi:hypothetical protein